MPYIRAAEELIKNLGINYLQDTLSNIHNDDFYEKDFTVTVKLVEFLYMLELYDLVFVTATSRVILTPCGENVLYKLNSLLYS